MIYFSHDDYIQSNKNNSDQDRNNAFHHLLKLYSDYWYFTGLK